MDTATNQELSNLKDEIYRNAKSPKDRLRALISTCSSWSEDPLKQIIIREIAVNMNSGHVSFLRNFIREQVESLNVKDANNLSDQILFIFLGALKFEIQRDAFSKHWQLAESSLESIISVSNKLKFGTFNRVLLGSFLVLITAIIYFNNLPTIESPSKYNNVEVNTYLEPRQPVPSPFVPSHFYSLRNQMSKSVCMIPQAATLPAEQRAAFITFLNTGEIEMSQLTNLQAALSLVHCEFIPLTLTLNQ